MAGIFNLFGDVTAPDKAELMHPLSRSKSSFGVNVASTKTLDQPKPKGLSIRSNSDVNISACSRSDRLNQGGYNKQQKYLKPKKTQLGSDDRLVSPRKEFIEKKLNETPKIKDLSPIKAVLNKRNMKYQSPFDDDVFKKPLPPKKFIKKSYPEPENLAPCDMQTEFDDTYPMNIESEFIKLLMEKQNEVEVEDDVSLLDLGPIEFDLPKISGIFTYEDKDENWEVDSGLGLDLPEISDNEDNF